MTTETDDQLDARINDLEKLRWNAMMIRDAAQFGRLDSELENAWREQDRRRKSNS